MISCRYQVDAMTDNSELHRLTRLRRLGRQIAASLPTNLDREQAFQVHGCLRELPAGAPRPMSKPTSNKAALRAQLEAALANYHGPVGSVRRQPHRSPIATMNWISLTMTRWTTMR
jgi:hypothetical protein